MLPRALLSPRIVARCRPSTSTRRLIHATVIAPYPRRGRASAQLGGLASEGGFEEMWAMENLDDTEKKPLTAHQIYEDQTMWRPILYDEKFRYDDIPSFGHDKIAQNRQYVEYMRYIELEGPELEKYRQPFEPLTHLPLRVRTIGYGGEHHPAERKVAITCPVSALGLSGAALHKFKLLAAARWSLFPPKDAGITHEQHEAEGKLGWFKISCEEFPLQTQNAKWCSDKIDLLVAESKRDAEYFESVPLDMRHIYVNEKKRPRHMPVRKSDFPLEWIPEHLREQARQKRQASDGVGMLPVR